MYSIAIWVQRNRPISEGEGQRVGQGGYCTVIFVPEQASILQLAY